MRDNVRLGWLLAALTPVIVLVAPSPASADDADDALAGPVTDGLGPAEGSPGGLADELPADVAYDVWYDRWGQSVADVPDGTEPSASWDLTGVLESPVDAGDQYAMRMRTLLTPPTTGTYRFAVAGDDDARLFLNPTGDDPIGARQIAYVAGWTTYRQFDRFAGQRSAWFELQGGQPYYVEVIGKEGSHGDHFSVAWEQQDGFGLTVVPPEVLEATALGSGGWRTATPSGLPSAPSPMSEPGWQSVEGVESLTIAWNAVAGAEWYEVRLEGSGEAREVVVDEPTVAFDGLVPETRYLVQVAPANAAARMPAAATVRVTLAGPYPTPVAPVAGDRPAVAYDRWDTGWWTLTSVPLGAPPASTGTLNFGFETPPMQGDNHAARIRAVVTPTKTADYTFFLAADDDARLFLNPDGIDARGAQPIASVAGWTEQYQWDRYQSQRSATFELRKGRSYYIEAISVHALGLDHLEVGWRRPGGQIEVIPNHVLSPTPAGGGGWRTDPSVLPEPPGRPIVTADGGVDAVVVGWSVPIADADHGAATFYEVTITGADTARRELVTERAHTFTDLPTDTEYDVTVTAWNDAGPGEQARATARTRDADPGDPGGGGVIPDPGEYAVLATGTAACQGIEISGASTTITGGARSNGTVGLYVGALSISGTLSYGVAIQPGSRRDGTVVHEPDPVGAGLPFDPAQLLAGDVPAGIPVHRHDRTLLLGPSPAKGIHLVQGDVTISGSSIDLTGVTVVATGVVNVSGSSMTASPAGSGLPSLATTSASCGRAAINLSSSTSTWSGIVAAPNGLVRVSGSQITGRAMVVGAAVRMSGASISLGHQQQSMQPASLADTAPPADIPPPAPAERIRTRPASEPTSPVGPSAAPTTAAWGPIARPVHCPCAAPAVGAVCVR